MALGIINACVKDQLTHFVRSENKHII